MLELGSDLSVDMAFAASEHAYRIERDALIRLFVDSFPEPTCPVLASMPERLLAADVPDSPRMRHWLSTTRAFLRADRHGTDVEAGAVGHFLVDDLDPARFLELHYARALELYVDHALVAGRPFELDLCFRPPLRVGFGRLGGCLLLDENDAHPTAWSISHDGKTLTCRLGTAGASLDTATGVWSAWGRVRTVSPMAIGHAGHNLEVPYHDPALTDSVWCNGPVLRARPAVHEWTEFLGQGFETLAAVDAGVAEACARLLPACLPLHTGSTSYGSSSPHEVLGLSFLPALRSPLDLAESILHEALHQKLYRIEASVSFFDPTSPQEEAYYSPWRPDGRPLLMVLHGAYVFAAVAELWAQLLPGLPADEQQRGSLQAYYRAHQALRACAVIDKYATLSHLGRRVFDPVVRVARDTLAVTHAPNEVARAAEGWMADHEMRHSQPLR